MNISKYIFIIFFAGLAACSKRHYIHSGTIEQYRIINFDPLKSSDIDSGKSLMWFKDSALIIEFKSTNKDLDGVVQDVVLHYTYIDLKTTRAQDYFNLRDTAKPFCNFEFTPRFVMPFLIHSYNEEKSSSYVRLPDRMEKGELVKSIQREDTFKNQTSTVYYLKKSKYDFILSGHPYFEKLLTPFKVFKIRIISPHNHGFLETGYRLVETSLNDKILAIFDAWEKNARETKLEVQTTTEKFSPCLLEVMRLPTLPIPLDHTTL